MKDLRKFKLETCYHETEEGMQPYPSIAVDDAVGLEIAEVFDSEDVAEEMVRRWNTQPDLLATLEAIHDGLASCETKDELLNTVGMCIVQARAAIQKATQP